MQRPNGQVQGDNVLMRVERMVTGQVRLPIRGKIMKITRGWLMLSMIVYMCY